MRYTPNGTAVANFSMATTEKFKNRDGELQERTTWWRVALWGKTAESLSQYLTKGKAVLVEGRINPDDNGNPRVFTRNDGSAGASYEVTAREIRLLGGGNGSAPSQDQDVPPAEDEDDEGIPF